MAPPENEDDLTRRNNGDHDWEEGTQAIERFSQAFADVPTEEAEAEVARIIAEVRANRRAEQEQSESESSSA